VKISSQLYTPFLIIITAIINIASLDETLSRSASGTPEPLTTLSVRNAFSVLIQSGGSSP
jgi:hypothetical protein